MSKKDTITVYWTPALFNTNQDAWDMLYPEPKFILSDLAEKYVHGGIMLKCPAIKNTMKNVISFYSAIDDNFVLPNKQMEEVAFTNSSLEDLSVNSKIHFRKERKSSMEGHINVGYNMSWLLFADESLEAKFTAPYFPPTSPVKNSFLSIGEFNIGKWFRQFNLDYHIPFDSKEFKVETGDPLVFVEFLTDKKIIMKRFELSPRLQSLMTEAGRSPSRYGEGMSLLKRYQMAHSAKIPQMILNEIKKNLVD
jgi:hypothetical protein